MASLSTWKAVESIHIQLRWPKASEAPIQASVTFASLSSSKRTLIQAEHDHAEITQPCIKSSSDRVCAEASVEEYCPWQAA